MDDRTYAERTHADRIAPADSQPVVESARAPYVPPVLTTVQGALTTLLGSAAECTVVEPPDQDFA